ncbi:hypothetical protein [Gordonia aichiensis]|nr:hypothetical protein [Gordonia aichiensis]
MTSAFLDSENTLSKIDSAVATAHEIAPRSRLRGEWNAVRERYAQATEIYLNLSSAPRPAVGEVARCTDALRSLQAEMERFGNANAAELGRATRTVDEVASLERQAQAAATQTRRLLGEAPRDLATLHSVRLAAEKFEAALIAQQSASGLLSRRAAAQGVLTAQQALDDALADAPSLAERAQRVIRTVDTRRSGIVTRAERMPADLSALRREFSLDCSADLQDNQQVLTRFLATSDEHLAKARSHLSDAPDLAITEAEAARDQLVGAEQAVEAVADRLRDLREVRADPKALEQRVRFRLRDAQHFAVDNALVDEWGSVLDAQADRIARSRSALDRVHPDYWAYSTELTAVERRVAEIVERMRGQVAKR